MGVCVAYGCVWVWVLKICGINRVSKHNFFWPHSESELRAECLLLLPCSGRSLRNGNYWSASPVIEGLPFDPSAHLLKSLNTALPAAHCTFFSLFPFLIYRASPPIKKFKASEFLANFSIGPPTYGHFPPSRAKSTLPCPIQIPTSSLARSPSNHHTNKHLSLRGPISPIILIQSSCQEIRKIYCCRNLGTRRPIGTAHTIIVAR